MPKKHTKQGEVVNVKIKSPEERLRDLRLHFPNPIWLDRAILFLQHFRTGSQSDEPIKVRMYDIKGINTYEIKTIIDRLEYACEAKVIVVVENTTEEIVWDRKKISTYTPVYASPKLIYTKKQVAFNSVFGYSKTIADIVLSDLYFIKQENSGKETTTFINDGSLNTETSVLQKYPNIALTDKDKSGLWSLSGYNKNELIPLGKNTEVFYRLIRNVLEYSGIKQQIDIVLSATTTDKGKLIVKSEKSMAISHTMKKLVKIKVDDFNKKLKSYNGYKQIISYKQVDGEHIILTLI